MTTFLALVRHPLAQTLGWTLIHFLWQGAALGLLAWLAQGLLSRASAKARYGLACAFLMLMVAAPVTTFLMLQRQAPAPPGVLTLNVEAAALPAPALVPLTQRVKATLDPALPWLLAGWAAGVLLLSTRFLGSWLRVQRLRRRSATPVPSEWHLVLSRLCRELNLSRTVRLLQSAAVEVPTALGWLRPVILLPACALTGLAPVQLEAILAHELAHVRRGDFLVNLLQSLVEVLLFYHPAVWWLSSRIRAERELCCDDVAAALCGDPLILARALTNLETLREPVAPSPTHLALAANGGSLMHRVRHLLHPALPVTSGARAAALALLAASLLGAAGVALQDKKPPPKGDQNTRMKVIDGDRQMDVRLKGEVKLDPAAKEPVTVPGDGSFRVEEKQGGKTRAYAASKDKRTYAVDGQEKPLDAEGEAWVREVVKDAAKAQAGQEKAPMFLEVRTRHLEARERELDARSRDLENQAKELERSAPTMTPEARAKAQAEGDRLKTEGAKLKAEGEHLRAEAERLRNDPQMKAPIAKTRAEGRKVRVEVMEKDGEGPGTIIIRKAGDSKNVLAKRYRIKKESAPGEDQEWAFTGPEGADDPQREMAEIQAELKSLQARLDQLQKQVATPREPPKTPKPPKAPTTPPEPDPFPVPLPPAPAEPPVPPAPPVPPPPPPPPPPVPPTPPGPPGA